MTQHVVIVGAGFGGLSVAQGLASEAVTITIIDQRNHHLFQPLLYQVATAALATSEIAWPIRHVMRKKKEVTTLLGVVNGVDAESRCVSIEGGQTISYDTLVLATGGAAFLFWARRMGAICAGPEDAGRCHSDPPPGTDLVRTRRT